MSINTFWVLLNNKHVYVDIKSTLYHKSIIKEVQSVRFCSVQSLRTCRHPASFFPQNSRPTFKTSKYPGHMFALLTSGPCLPPLFVCIALLTHTHTHTIPPSALWQFAVVWKHSSPRCPLSVSAKQTKPTHLSVCLSTRRPPPSIHTYCCRHVWQHTHTRTHTYARMHTYAHARTHTRTHTYAHTLNICSWITLETKDIIDFHSVL